MDYMSQCNIQKLVSEMSRIRLLVVLIFNLCLSRTSSNIDKNIRYFVYYYLFSHGPLIVIYNMYKYMTS